MTEEQKTLRAHIETFFAALPPFAWAAAFVLWAFTPGRKELPALFTGAALCLFGALATIRAISGLRDGKSAAWEKPFVPKSRADSYDKRHPVGRILLFALFARVALVAALYLLDQKTQGGYAGGLFERTALWNKSFFTSPAGRLIGSAPDTLLDSVGPACFPLFPALCTAIAPAFPEPFFAGMAVSNLFSVIAAPLLWEFVLLDGTVKDAKRALVFLLLSPVSFIFLYANEASMALAFGLAALLLSRRRRLLFSSLFALAAILVHPFSALLIVVLLWDRLGELSRDREARVQKSFTGNALALFFAMLPAVGLLIPVLLAELKTGSLPEAVSGMAAIPFFEETALRVTGLFESFPADAVSRARVLIPVIIPALPLLTVLAASGRLRPKYAAALILSVFSLSLLSLRDVFPVFAGSPLLLQGASAVGRRPLLRILLVLLSVSSFALCAYAVGTGLL